MNDAILSERIFDSMIAIKAIHNRKLSKIVATNFKLSDLDAKFRHYPVLMVARNRAQNGCADMPLL